MPEMSTTPDRHELVRRSLEAAGLGDVEGAIGVYTPDGVWDMSLLGVGTFVGQSAIRGFFEDWWGAYESFANELREFVEIGPEITLAVVEQWGRPRGSSGEVRLLYAAVGVWEDAEVVHATLYTDIDEARVAAARLVEQRADG